MPIRSLMLLHNLKLLQRLQAKLQVFDDVQITSNPIVNFVYLLFDLTAQLLYERTYK